LDLIAALVASMTLPAVVTATPSGLVVTTASGRVAGIANGSVDEWRGIPYAQPPVGSLRWRSPQAPLPWGDTRDATHYGAHCIQLISETETEGSEDCLYLNVFTPANTAANARLPVMVHLHPGGNGFGWGYQNGGRDGATFFETPEFSRFTDRGVIVVTLNYRLGVMGWVGHPALTAEGSLPEQGLLDQIAALRWVQQNIGAFGGDPAKVTLFGMSAGSFDTVALAASPLAVGLFARAAVETDVFWQVTGDGNSLADKEQVGLDVANHVGCASATDVAACLRGTSAAALAVAAGAIDTSALVGGAVLPRSALAVFQERGAGVPLLIGSNREEAAFVIDSLPDPFRNADFVRNVNDLVGSKNQSSALKLYPASAYDSLQWDLVTMISDALYTCPTRRLALAASSHGATYRYLFTHVAENDPGQANFRAAHTFEDTYLWHHFDPRFEDGAPYVATPPEEALSTTMTSYWTNFAKTGDPNGAGLPSWPRFDQVQQRFQILDDAVHAEAGYHVAQCGLMDTLPRPYPFCGSLCRFDSSGWLHRFGH